MPFPTRGLMCALLLCAGCGLVLGLAGGQDAPREKGKKEKGPKDKKGDPEEKAVLKSAEKATKGSETERDKWLKELNKFYPGEVSPGVTREDFEQWFGLLAGRDGWRREDAPAKQVAELHDRATERLGADGPIGRDQFLDYAAQFLRPGGSPPWKVHDPLAEADKLFRQLDRDGSGFLEPDEWTERLRAAAPRADADRDGRINRDEYRAYFEGRVVTVLETGSEPPVAPSPPPEDRPPVALRYGHLPNGLPTWFAELDTDQDGQVGLYEWRTAKRPLAEFNEMDLNADGLLPPDEYLRCFRAQQTRLRYGPAAVR